MKHAHQTEQENFNPRTLAFFKLGSKFPQKRFNMRYMVAQTGIKIKRQNTIFSPYPPHPRLGFQRYMLCQHPKIKVVFGPGVYHAKADHRLVSMTLLHLVS